MSKRRQAQELSETVGDRSMKRRHIWLLVTMMGLLLPFAAGAQDAPGAAEEPFTTFKPDDPVTDKNEESTELISVAFEEAPLSMVVNVFTKWSGANIIATPSNLTGTVTVNLEDVEWRPALRSILEMHDLTLIERVTDSEVYSIVPIEPGAPPPMVVESIRLKYAPVDDVIAVLQPLVTAGGTLSPLPSRNIVVIRATEDSISKMKKVIDDVDIPREQVYIEAKFLELTDSAIRDVGINWQVLQAYQISAGNFSLNYSDDRTDNSSDSFENTRLDNNVRRDVEARTFDITGAEFENFEDRVLGIDEVVSSRQVPLDASNDGRPLPFPSRSFDNVRTATEDSSAGFLKETTRNISDMRTAVLSADDFRLVLSALEQISGASVVSNPKIIVANEEEARIHIGDKEPNIRGQVTAGQQGQANTTVYQLDESEPYFEFGISLDVRPTINTASNITLSIQPVLSRFIANKAAPDGTTFPITSQREIQTVFSLDSGKTAAIGGLTETEELNNDNKVPLLNKIPLVGKYLFNHESDQVTQRETIIFVTVGLANPESMHREIGLPTETYLSRKKNIELERKARKNQQEIDALQQALDAENKREADRAASLLDKKS